MVITNKLDLPEPFVQAAASDHTYKPHRYSVTEVLGGTCEAVLKRRHHGEAEEDVADMLWAILGTAVHEVLRRAEGTETQLQENWISVPVGIDDYELSGIFDLYDDSTGTVTDYKSTSVYKVQFQNFADWRDQTLLYCWMLRKLGFDARRGEIVAMLRDHSNRKAKFERDYPPHPVHKESWDFGGQDLEQIKEHVKAWFEEVIRQEQLPDSELEPCSPEQRWHKDDKWAVMRKGQKRAVKLFDSKEKALEFMDWLANQASNKGKPLYIEERKGEDTKCESYCSVSEFCPYWKALHAE